MEDIEYLEEYEDLILPTIQTNSGNGGGLRSSNMMQDEDSSSIDQDIFESLFDDHSDDENNILQKKADPKLSQRRADDRASLDSLDMLVKDLVGEQHTQKKTQNSNAANKTPIQSLHKKITNTSIGGRPGQRGRPQIRGAMGRAALPHQKRSSLPSTSSDAAGGSSKPSFSNSMRPDLHKYDKVKSVATVRPTMLQKQQQIKRFQHTGIATSRGRPALTRGGLQSSSVRKPATIQRGSFSRKSMQRPPTTIVKPEKRETKDPSEDPLSLDDIAEALLDSDSDSFSLSDISDESLDSLSDLEDSQNIIDISNDSSIDGKLNHKDLDNVRTDTPSPTVSEVDKDDASSSPQSKTKFNKLGIKEQDEVVKQSLLSLLGEDDDDDNETLNQVKKSSEKVTIISDTLLKRIDNALLDSNTNDNKPAETNEYTNQSNEDVVAALERELMPFLKKKNSTDSREDGDTKTIGITITPANLSKSDSDNMTMSDEGVQITSTVLADDNAISPPVKDLAVSSTTGTTENNTVSNSNMINELSQAVFGIDSDVIEGNLNEIQQETNPGLENEEITESILPISNEIDTNSDANKLESFQEHTGEYVDDGGNIPETMNEFHNQMEDAFLNEQVAMEVEVETIKDTEFEVDSRTGEFEVVPNAEEPAETSVSCHTESNEADMLEKSNENVTNEILPTNETNLDELGKDIALKDSNQIELVSKRSTRKRGAESPLIEENSAKKEFKEPINTKTKDGSTIAESPAMSKRTSRSPALSEKSREGSPQSVKKVKLETKRKSRRFRNLDDPTDTSETDFKVKKNAPTVEETSVDTGKVLDHQTDTIEKSEECDKSNKLENTYVTTLQKEINNPKDSSPTKIDIKIADKENEVAEGKDIPKKLDTPEQVESSDKNAENESKGCGEERTNSNAKPHTEDSQHVKQNDSKHFEEIKFPMKVCKIKINRIPDNYEHHIAKIEKNSSKIQSDIKIESTGTKSTSNTNVDVIQTGETSNELLKESKELKNVSDNEKEDSKADESKVDNESHLSTSDDNKQSKQIEYKKETNTQITRKSMRTKGLDESSGTSSDSPKNSQLSKKALKLKESEANHTKEDLKQDVKEVVHGKRKYIRTMQKGAEDVICEKQSIDIKIEEQEKIIKDADKSTKNSKNAMEVNELTKQAEEHVSIEAGTKTSMTESPHSKSTDKTEHRPTPQKIISRKIIAGRATRSRNLESPNVEKDVKGTKSLDDAITDKKLYKNKERKQSSEIEGEAKQKAVDEKIIHTHGTRKATRNKTEDLSLNLKEVTKPEDFTNHDESDVEKKLPNSKEKEDKKTEIKEKIELKTDSEPNKQSKPNDKEDTTKIIKTSKPNSEVHTNSVKGTLVGKIVSTPSIKTGKNMVVTKRNYKFQGLLKRSFTATSSNISNTTINEDKQTKNSTNHDIITSTNAENKSDGSTEVTESVYPQDITQKKKVETTSEDKTKEELVEVKKESSNTAGTSGSEDDRNSKLVEKVEPNTNSTKDNLKNVPFKKRESAIIKNAIKSKNNCDSPKSKTAVSSSTEQKDEEKLNSTTINDSTVSNDASKESLPNKSGLVKKPTVEKRPSSKGRNSNNSEKSSQDALNILIQKTNESNNKTIESIASVDETSVPTSEKSTQEIPINSPRKTNESKTIKPIEGTSSSKKDSNDSTETPNQVVSENTVNTISKSSLQKNEPNIKINEIYQNKTKQSKPAVPKAEKLKTKSLNDSSISKKMEANSKKSIEKDQQSSTSKTSKEIVDSKCSSVKIFKLNISKEVTEDISTSKNETMKSQPGEKRISQEDNIVDNIVAIENANSPEKSDGKKFTEKTVEKSTKGNNKPDTKNTNTTKTIQHSEKTEKSTRTSNKKILDTISSDKLVTPKAKKATKGSDVSTINRSISEPENEANNSVSTQIGDQNTKSIESVSKNNSSTASKLDEKDSLKSKANSKLVQNLEKKTKEKTKITFESFEKSTNPLNLTSVISPEKINRDEISSKGNLINESKGEETKDTSLILNASSDENTILDDKSINALSPTKRRTKRPKSEVEILIESCPDILTRGNIAKRRRHDHSPAFLSNISSTKTIEFRTPPVPCKSHCSTPVPAGPTVIDIDKGTNARKKLLIGNKSKPSFKCREVRVKLNRSLVNKYYRQLESKKWNTTPVAKKTSKNSVKMPTSQAFLTVKSVEQLTMDANTSSNGPENVVPATLSNVESSASVMGLSTVADEPSSTSKSKVLTDEANTSLKPTSKATSNRLQLRSTTTRASVLTIPPQNRRPPATDVTLSTSLQNDSSVYSIGSPNISSNSQHNELLVSSINSVSQTEQQQQYQQQEQSQQQQKRLTRFQQHQQAMRQTPPSTPQLPKTPVVCSSQTDNTSAAITPVTTCKTSQIEQFTPIEPKKEIEDEPTSSANMSSFPTSASVMTGIPAAIVDNSGTRLYSFLHPLKYNRSHGSVLLDYCCPNLEGPMPAIDPTREHSQVQSLVRELPAYIVMTTKVVTRADLESKNNSIPASIRKKMEKLTSVQQSSNAVGRSSGSSTNTIAPASNSPLQPLSNLNFPTSISALQKQLPPSTKITPKLAPLTMAPDNLPPLTPFSAMTNASSLPGSNPQPVSEFQRGVMRANLRRFDTLLKKYSLRINVLTYSERQSIINKILNQALFTLKDVDVATRLLDQYCHAVNNIPLSKAHLTPPAITTSTSTVSTITVVPHSSISTTAPSSSNAAAQQLDELHASAVQKLKTGSATQAQRQVPIYDKDRNVIGYQMQVASTKSTNSTRSGIMATMSSSSMPTTSKRVPVAPTLSGTPASTLKQPAQESPRIFYTKPLQSSTPIQPTPSSTMESAGRLGRNITIRYLPKNQMQVPTTQNQAAVSKLPNSPNVSTKSRNSTKSNISNVSQPGLNVSTTKTTVTLATAPTTSKRQTRLMVTKGRDGQVGPLENNDECILPDDERSGAELREIKREKEDDYVVGAS